MEGGLHSDRPLLASVNPGRRIARGSCGGVPRTSQALALGPVPEWYPGAKTGLLADLASDVATPCGQRAADASFLETEKARSDGSHRLAPHRPLFVPRPPLHVMLSRRARPLLLQPYRHPVRRPGWFPPRAQHSSATPDADRLHRRCPLVPQRPLYVAYLDFSSAFTMTHFPRLAQILRLLGVPPDAISTIEALYSGASTRIATPYGPTGRRPCPAAARHHSGLPALPLALPPVHLASHAVAGRDRPRPPR